jgi:hypothetical protein
MCKYSSHVAFKWFSLAVYLTTLRKLTAYNLKFIFTAHPETAVIFPASTSEIRYSGIILKCSQLLLSETALWPGPGPGPHSQHTCTLKDPKLADILDVSISPFLVETRENLPNRLCFHHSAKVLTNHVGSFRSGLDNLIISRAKFNL